MIEESLGQFERSNKLDPKERLIFFIVEKYGWVVRSNKWSLVKEEECVLFAQTALRETQTHGSNTTGTQTHGSNTKRDNTDTEEGHRHRQIQALTPRVIYVQYMHVILR